MNSRRLFVAEVAELLGKSQSWIYHHAAELGGFKAGRDLRFPPEAIARYEREHRVCEYESEAIDERALLEQAAREVR